MPRETLPSRAALYLGFQESYGPCDGPNIRRWRSMLGSGSVASFRSPWHSIFVFAMLMERNGLQRGVDLASQLGFDLPHFFPGSPSSWVQQVAEGCSRCSWVEIPRAGDLLILMQKEPGGYFSSKKADSILISRGTVDAGSNCPTIEGGTLSDRPSGSSREGASVCERIRTLAPKGRVRILRLPSYLTGYMEASE